MNRPRSATDQTIDQCASASSFDLHSPFQLCIHQPHRPAVAFRPQLPLEVSIQRALEHPAVGRAWRRIRQLPLGEEPSEVLLDASLRELEDPKHVFCHLFPPRCLVSRGHVPQVPISALVGFPLAVLKSMPLHRPSSLGPRLVEAVRSCERVRTSTIMVSVLPSDGSQDYYSFRILLTIATSHLLPDVYQPKFPPESRPILLVLVGANHETPESPLRLSSSPSLRRQA